jgi:NADPH:quinone reductase-like Zn-dependent oxidoreductase
MRVVKLKSPGGLDHLEVVEIADPGPPGPGEALIRVRASSLNYHDYGVVSGRSPAADGRIPLSDMGGEIEALGEGVSDFSVGDAVVSTFFPQWRDGPPCAGDFSKTPGDGVDGFARERVVLPVKAFTHAPKGWSHAEAATLTTAGLTAWRALFVDGALKPGDTVLVLGTGGVSLFALQLARAAGATVVATSSSEDKLQRLKDLGAAQTFNYRRDPDWGRRVFDWTGGRGVDHVLEVGGPGSLPQSIEALAIGGHVALIGLLAGVTAEIFIPALLSKHVRLQGLIVGSRRHQEDMIRALDAGDIRPVLDRSFRLEDLADAFRHEESGKHFGKITVDID